MKEPVTVVQGEIFELLTEPLSGDSLKQHTDEDGYITGVVELPAKDLIEAPLMQTNCRVAQLLCRASKLYDFSFCIVGGTENTCYLKAKGSLSPITVTENQN